MTAEHAALLFLFWVVFLQDIWDVDARDVLWVLQKYFKVGNKEEKGTDAEQLQKEEWGGVKAAAE